MPTKQKNNQLKTAKNKQNRLICGKCNAKLPTKSHLYCLSCRNKKSVRDKARYEERKKAKICHVCKSPNLAPKSPACTPCIKYRRAFGLERTRSGKAKKAKRAWLASDRGKELKRQCDSRRRARKLGFDLPESVTSLVSIESLLEVQNSKCLGCSRFFNGDLKPTLDHLVALAAGGAHQIDNFILLCKSCNCQKGVRPFKEFMKMEKPWK